MSTAILNYVPNKSLETIDIISKRNKLLNYVFIIFSVIYYIVCEIICGNVCVHIFRNRLFTSDHDQTLERGLLPSDLEIIIVGIVILLKSMLPSVGNPIPTGGPSILFIIIRSLAPAFIAFDVFSAK